MGWDLARQTGGDVGDMDTGSVVTLGYAGPTVCDAWTV